MMCKRRPSILYIAVFAVLVFIPIIGMAVSLSVSSYKKELGSALELIELSQKSMLSVLQKEIHDMSLRLTHMMNLDQGSLLTLAADVAAAKGDDYFSAYGLLQNRVEKMLDPSTDIISLVFYFSDGSIISASGTALLSFDGIATASWYESAVFQRGKVFVGALPDTDEVEALSLSRKHIYLAAAYAPKKQNQNTADLQAVVLFFRSQIEDLLVELDGNTRLGNMYIMTKTGRILASNVNTVPVLPDHGEIYNQFIFYLDPEKVDSAYLDYAANNQSYKCIVRSLAGVPLNVVTVLNQSRLLHDFYAMLFRICICVGFVICVFIIFAVCFMYGFIFPLEHLQTAFSDIEKGDLSYRIADEGVYETKQLQTSFNAMVCALEQKHKNEVIASQQIFEAEYRSLRAQINPHFLVNMLNSLRFMAQVAKFDSLKNMAEALIRILSASYRGNTSLWTIQDETELLQSYTYLMKIRYSDSFDVSYEISDGCLDCLLPRLTLQPILENSIVHGFDNMDVPGLITIKIFRDSDSLCIEVIDNGGSMDRDDVNKILNSDSDIENMDYCKIGLWNINNRLKMNYGSGYGLTISGSPGELTSTLIRIPYQIRSTHHV